MNRFVHADANLFEHIRTLRIVTIFLSLSLIFTIYGWYHASRSQRISIPPDLRYGGQVISNSINPWEVYNFAGYIWQQLNRCESDCQTDYPNNIKRLAAFFTPEFKAWLEKESTKRTSELRGRTRYILPSTGANYINSVANDSSDTWTVSLNVDLQEHIGGVAVKTVKITYFLKVIKKPIDPEFNPWGLLLDIMSYPPKRNEEK